MHTVSFGLIFPTLQKLVTHYWILYGIVFYLAQIDHWIDPKPCICTYIQQNRHPQNIKRNQLITCLAWGRCVTYWDEKVFDSCRLAYSITSIAQWTNVLMQGHCNQNGYFGYVSGNLVSIQKSFYKLTAIPQAWPRIYFKSIFKKLAKLDRVRLTS